MVTNPSNDVPSYVKDYEGAFMERARRLSDICKKNGFAGVRRLYAMNLEKACALYDGVGPNWDYSVISKIVGHIKEIFAPAAFLHDIAYKTSSDRSKASFDLVNRQFYENCLKCARLSYGWYDPRRYFAYRSAKVLFKACEKYGADDWKSCGRKLRTLNHERYRLSDGKAVF